MAKQRKINLAEYEKQLAENIIGKDQLVEIAVNHEQSVWIKIPIDLHNANGDTFKEMSEEIQACGSDEKAAALVILAGHPTLSPQEQLDLWLETGRTAGLLLNIWANEAREARERALDFHYRG